MAFDRLGLYSTLTAASLAASGCESKPAETNAETPESQAEALVKDLGKMIKAVREGCLATIKTNGIQEFILDPEAHDDEFQWANADYADRTHVNTQKSFKSGDETSAWCDCETHLIKSNAPWSSSTTAKCEYGDTTTKIELSTFDSNALGGITGVSIKKTRHPKFYDAGIGMPSDPKKQILGQECGGNAELIVNRQSRFKHKFPMKRAQCQPIQDAANAAIQAIFQKAESIKKPQIKPKYGKKYGKKSGR